MDILLRLYGQENPTNKPHLSKQYNRDITLFIYAHLQQKTNKGMDYKLIDFCFFAARRGEKRLWVTSPRAVNETRTLRSARFSEAKTFHSNLNVSFFIHFKSVLPRRNFLFKKPYRVSGLNDFVKNVFGCTQHQNTCFSLRITCQT